MTPIVEELVKTAAGILMSAAVGGVLIAAGWAGLVKMGLVEPPLRSFRKHSVAPR